MGISYAYYDEGAWQNILGNGDMSIAPEIIGLLEHQLNSKITTIQETNFRAGSAQCAEPEQYKYIYIYVYNRFACTHIQMI